MSARTPSPKRSCFRYPMESWVSWSRGKGTGAGSSRARSRVVTRVTSAFFRQRCVEKGNARGRATALARREGSGSGSEEYLYVIGDSPIAGEDGVVHRQHECDEGVRLDDGPHRRERRGFRVWVRVVRANSIPVDVLPVPNARGRSSSPSLPQSRRPPSFRASASRDVRCVCPRTGGQRRRVHKSDALVLANTRGSRHFQTGGHTKSSSSLSGYGRTHDCGFRARVTPRRA